MVHWEGGNEVVEEGHLIVAEYKTYTNSVFVKGNREVPFSLSIINAESNHLIVEL